MTFYEEMRELAVEMLDEFGEAATLTRNTSTFDKAKGKEVTATSTVINTTALVQDEEYKDDAGRIAVRTVATLSDKPTMGDKLALGSRSWTVGTVRSVQPTTTAIVYFAEVA